MSCGKVSSILDLNIGYSKYDVNYEEPRKACPECGSTYLKGVNRDD